MKTKDTIKILEQQLDEAPHSPQLWEDLADLYLQREQVDKAIDAYEFALAIEPDRESALCKRSIAYLATDNPALHQKGKTYLETYSRQHPEQTELRDMLDRLNRLVDESMPSFLPSDDKETQEDSLLDVLHRPAEEEDFDIDWDLLRNPDTDFETYIDIIDQLFECRSYEKAREALDMLLALHPEEATLYLDYGILLMLKDKEKEAEKYFDKALLKASHSEDLDFFLGEIGFQYFNKQYYLDALDYYFRIRNPEELHEHLPYIADCCLELNYPKLYKDYVLRLDPENDDEQCKEIHRAFYGHLPLNLRPDEMKPFLLKLFDRYNS